MYDPEILQQWNRTFTHMGAKIRKVLNVALRQDLLYNVSTFNDIAPFQSFIYSNAKMTHKCVSNLSHNWFE